MVALVTFGASKMCGAVSIGLHPSGFWAVYSGTQAVLTCASLEAAVAHLKAHERDRRRVAKPVKVERRAQRPVPPKRRANDLRPRPEGDKPEA